VIIPVETSGEKLIATCIRISSEMDMLFSEKDSKNGGLGAEDPDYGDPKVGQTKLTPLEFNEQKDLRCVSLVMLHWWRPF
jgi:hypothetical protein